MAKKIVKYLLDGDGSVPKFIEDGGYFRLGEELVGRSVDEDIRHVPISVIRFTRATLLTHIQNAHKSGGVYLTNPNTQLQWTDTDMDNKLDAFLTAMGLADYA